VTLLHQIYNLTTEYIYIYIFFLLNTRNKPHSTSGLTELPHDDKDNLEYGLIIHTMYTLGVPNICATSSTKFTHN